MVPTKQLRRTCPPVKLPPAKQADEGLGQEQAMSAIELALQMMTDNYARSHYNVVVVGSPNTGRTARTLHYLRKRAEQEPCDPPDAVALHDFDSSRRFVVAHVPRGTGEQLKELLADFGKKVMLDLPREIEQFQEAQLRQAAKFRQQLLGEIDAQIRVLGFMLVFHEEDFGFLPISFFDPEKAMLEEEFDELDEDIRQKLEETQPQVRQIIENSMAPFSDLIVEMLKGSMELAKTYCQQLLLPARELADENELFCRYLDGLINLSARLAAKPLTSAGQQIISIVDSDESEGGDKEEDEHGVLFNLCQVEILSNNSQQRTKPVIYAEIPQYSRLFGRINAEPAGHEGMIRFDHTLVEGGALLDANGGYLVLNLNDLLRWGGSIAFYKLLEVVRTGRLTIETKAGFVDETFIDFRSNEIPLDIRVIAVCDRYLETTLRQIEPEFDNLFRITSEFEYEMDIDLAPTIYGRFVQLCRRSSNLPPFTPTAVAKLVEYGSRRVADQRKASTELGIIKDIATEAACWARMSGAKQVRSKHVQQALQARFDRRALIVRNHQQFVDDGNLLLTLTGTKVGQVNGLGVLEISEDVRWGEPMCITARAFAGEERVVLVQRRAELSGKTSNSAVDIITGYLCGKYGRRKPFGVTAQLSFEQTYNGVDGDSASLAEVIAIISAITELPVNQSLAITGSMNQWGEVQPIGGINEKIEGHFGVLNRRKLLSGEHGVVLPVQNLVNLMLDEEIVEAQRQGLYQVFAVRHIDEALELFLGKPVTEIDQLVETKLAEINCDKKEKTGKNKTKKHPKPKSNKS